MNEEKFRKFYGTKRQIKRARARARRSLIRPYVYFMFTFETLKRGIYDTVLLRTELLQKELHFDAKEGIWFIVKQFPAKSSAFSWDKISRYFASNAEVKENDPTLAALTALKDRRQAIKLKKFYELSNQIQQSKDNGLEGKDSKKDPDSRKEIKITITKATAKPDTTGKVCD